MSSARAYAGLFCHAPVQGQVEILEGGLVEVGADGVISAVVAAGDPDYASRRRALADAGALTVFGPGQYVLPGFVDLHIHAPQYPQAGVNLDRPLQDWLQHYTFPLEARYAHLGFARSAYTQLVGDLLAHGTTTALMFATVHTEPTLLLADICLEKGLRALIGKTVMDHPDTCPETYRDASVWDALRGSRAVIDHLAAHPANTRRLVQPVLTPRFIPACSDAVLSELGRMAGDTGCHVQTHCAESDWEHGHVFERLGCRDAEALDRFALLTRRTIVAHGTLLSDGDLGLLSRRGSGVAHCAHSNVYFGDAVFPLRRALAKGVRVGLGTDISGGPCNSIFDAVRMTVAASRMLEQGVDAALPREHRGVSGSRVDWRTAFHLATAGGADALDLPVGRFAPGMRFDAMLVDVEAPRAPIRLFDAVDDAETALQKILYACTRANISAVWVDGRQVVGEGAAP